MKVTDDNSDDESEISLGGWGGSWEISIHHIKLKLLKYSNKARRKWENMLFICVIWVHWPFKY